MAKKQPWSPLDLSKLPPCEILACDPSLTALGVVWLQVDDSGAVIRGAEKLSTAQTADRKGWEDTFFRAELMEALIDALLDSWEIDKLSGEDLFAVHEAPPTAGGSLIRIESTILTGYAFRAVVREMAIDLAPTVTPQSHKKLISGNHIAKKPEHHAALKELFPQIRNSAAITNEATRDALSIGLYAAHRLGAQ